MCIRDRRWPAHAARVQRVVVDHHHRHMILRIAAVERRQHARGDALRLRLAGIVQTERFDQVEQQAEQDHAKEHRQAGIKQTQPCVARLTRAGRQAHCPPTTRQPIQPGMGRAQVVQERAQSHPIHALSLIHI